MAVRGLEEEESLLQHLGDDNTANPLRRVPSEKPPFTLSQIKNAIPPHCFRRSVLRSFSYLLLDVVIAGIFFYLAVAVIPTLQFPYRLLAWSLYWAVQGCVLMGIWVIAHECGHNAFSDYSHLDNAIGFVLHSFLLVPYFSWKYSHRRHHSNTGSIDRDEAFVPKLRSSLSWFSPFLKNPVSRVFSLTIGLTLGWSMYLLFNFSGRYYDRFACHYDPYSPIYNARERAQVLISDGSILAVSYFLYRFTASYSLAWVLCVYGVPLLIVNAWIVLIVRAHHTQITHTATKQWKEENKLH